MQHYMAEAGDLVCVSNFPTAVLDLPIRSSTDNQELLFEAFMAICKWSNWTAIYRLSKINTLADRRLGT